MAFLQQFAETPAERSERVKFESSLRAWTIAIMREKLRRKQGKKIQNSVVANRRFVTWSVRYGNRINPYHINLSNQRLISEAQAYARANP